MLPPVSRLFRQAPLDHVSSPGPEDEPFLESQTAHRSSDSDNSDAERGISGGEPEPKTFLDPGESDIERDPRNGDSCIPPSRWQRRWRIPFLSRLVGRRRGSYFVARGEKTTSRRRNSVGRALCRLVFLSFMIFGVLHFIALLFGLYLAFFPDELDWPESVSFSTSDAGHWPTDITADTLPVECHSHNDYWRKEPLFSALNAGCTGVEADVWLFDDDLYVGHNEASLTPARTLQSLYINPILELLDKHNPIHEFHPDLDTPRNGLFDTRPTQNLVLLIDFKKDGEALWPYVYKQLEPLRQRKYLTYFNGTAVVDGPIVVVATGNAPFRRVVENSTYRDIFFDAPLDFMDKVSSSADASELSSQNVTSAKPNSGQGHSGAAPSDPNAYSLHNSYFASVSFKKTILGFPMLWRNRLSDAQLKTIREQIAGAHARGLKVRYWNVPEWPVSMRNYLWRVLVKEGVDYLCVDDLKSATKGEWGKSSWSREKGWWFGQT